MIFYKTVNHLSFTIKNLLVYSCIYSLTLILDAFVILDYFRPVSKPLCYLFCTKFCFEYLYYIYRQFQILLLCQIALGLLLGCFVIYFVSDSTLDACIISMDRIRAYYPIEIECRDECGKILIGKSTHTILLHSSYTRFRFLI